MRALIMSIGMFTSIPASGREWRDGDGPAIMCWIFVPGLMCGAVPWAVFAFLDFLPGQLRAFIQLCAVYAFTGYLHLDGLMDSADSLLSGRGREEKLRILKDSTVGSFAALTAVFTLLGELCALWAWNPDPVQALLMPVITCASRTFSAVLLFSFKALEGSSMMRFFKLGQKPRHRVISSTCFLACLVASAVISPFAVIALVTGAAAALVLALHANRELAGINGDVTGACIIVFELCALLASAVIFSAGGAA